MDSLLKQTKISPLRYYWALHNLFAMGISDFP